jgi:uroporphyrinogen-III decarboxylase
MNLHVAESDPSDRLNGYDFRRHNEEVSRVREAFDSGKPIRTPILLGTASRYFQVIPGANPEGWDYRVFSEDPDAMFEATLHYLHWRNFNLLQDVELGLPDVWHVFVDFQNYYDAAWFGCPVVYRDEQVPDTLPVFSDCPERVMERGIPDPFSGLFARGLEFKERFEERCREETFLGRPIVLDPCLIGTDGLMTVACSLFGPEFVCTAMATEPARLGRLFEFINQAVIERMKAWRKVFDLPMPVERFGYADDSIALISVEMYRDHVLPHHRLLFDSFADESPRSIHLCGNATRHFRLLRDDLGIRSFDTGYPVDFGKLREELGPDVRILGGPRVDFLQKETPDRVFEEARRILQSGILKGGLFILREGNNLAPHTPLENTEALYRAGREFGTRENFDRS